MNEKLSPNASQLFKYCAFIAIYHFYSIGQTIKNTAAIKRTTWHVNDWSSAAQKIYKLNFRCETSSLEFRHQFWTYLINIIIHHHHHQFERKQILFMIAVDFYFQPFNNVCVRNSIYLDSLDSELCFFHPSTSCSFDCAKQINEKRKKLWFVWKFQNDRRPLWQCIDKVVQIRYECDWINWPWRRSKKKINILWQCDFFGYRAIVSFAWNHLFHSCEY